MEKIAYCEMFENELTHGWYLGTRNLLVSILKKYLPTNAKILDAGCGTGGTIVYLKKTGFSNIFGIDNSKLAISFCRQRKLTNIKSATVNHLPFKDQSFDAVICLDVLYHQGVNQHKTISEFSRVLKKDGLLYIQEPAYNWLKSKHDKIVSTERRFTKGSLKEILELARFEIIKLSYFNTLLFPGLALKRLADKLLGPNSKTSDITPLPKQLNSLLKQFLFFETTLVKFLYLPFGLSVICLCKK